MRKLVVSLLLLTLGACGSQTGSSKTVSAETCAAPATYSAIQKIIFDDLRKNYTGDVKYINDLNNLFKANVYAPTLNDIDKDTDKADCKGRLTLSVPSSLSEQFGRQPSLTADIGYTIQPSADGSGFVYTVGGYDDVLQSMLNAASTIEGTDQSSVAPKGTFTGPVGRDVSIGVWGAAVTQRSATVNMRASPSSNGLIISSIPYGASVYIISQQGSWYFIEYGGHRGWANTGYIQRY